MVQIIIYDGIAVFRTMYNVIQTTERINRQVERKRGRQLEQQKHTSVIE